MSSSLFHVLALIFIVNFVLISFTSKKGFCSSFNLDSSNTEGYDVSEEKSKDKIHTQRNLAETDKKLKNFATHPISGRVDETSAFDDQDSNFYDENNEIQSENEDFYGDEFEQKSTTLETVDGLPPEEQKIVSESEFEVPNRVRSLSSIPKNNDSKEKSREDCNSATASSKCRKQNESQSEIEIYFRPRNLVYRDVSVFIPKMLEFSIENPSSIVDIHIFSVTSSDKQFHPVMFQPQILAPRTFVDVKLLFLPHRIETSMSELLISTSIGEFYYTVEGRAVTNPYHLYPLVGYRLPLGTASFDVPINIYNPHHTPLHIREVFTTEDFLTLKGLPTKSSAESFRASSSSNRSLVAAAKTSLPAVFHTVETVLSSMPENSAVLRIGDVVEAKNHTFQSALKEQVEFMWVVQPGSEKEIITLSISKNMTPGDYKGYFHVKTDHDNIVLLVEFQIVEGGAYSASEIVDFGLLTTVAEKKTMELRLLNSQLSNLLVLEVVMVEVDPQLEITLYDNPIIYSGNTPSVVGKLVYTASFPGKMSNKILVLTNNSNAAMAAVEIPYTATILHGGVGFEHQKAVFVVPVRNVSYLSMIRQLSRVKYRISQCDECIPFEDPKNNHITPRFRSISQCKHEVAQARSQQESQIITREFLLTNYFSVPVTLQAVSISACTEVLSAESSIFSNNSADSLNKWDPVILRFNQSKVLSLCDKDRSFLPKTCWLEILTNISSHRVPLHIIDGSLSISFMDVPMVEDVLDINKYQSIKLPCSQPTISVDDSPFTQTQLTTNISSNNNVASQNRNSSVLLDGIFRINRKQKSKQTVCSTSVINSDVYFVELGNISVHEPRIIKLALSNENPVRIPLDIEYASHKVCFCYESSWPIGLKDEDAAVHHIAASHGKSFFEARNEPSRCTCNDLLENNTSTNISRSEDSKFATSDAKKAKSSYHSLFSLSFSSPLTSMYTQRTPTKSNFKHRRMDNGSQIESHSSIRKNVSSSVIENLPLPSSVLFSNATIRCERQMVKIIFSSQYQNIQLNVFFTATEGRLITKVAPDDKSTGGQFYLGTDTMLKLSTISSFEEYIKDPQFSLSGDDFSLVFTSSLNNKVFNRIRPGGTVSYSIYPSSLDVCGGSSDPSKQNNNILSNDFAGNSVSLWSCSYDFLRKWNYSLQSAGVLFDELKYLSTAIMDLETPVSAYQIRLRLKKKWQNTFRDGIALPSTNLVIQSSQTRHLHQIQNTSVQSPLVSMPDLYTIELPTSRMGDFTWFYIEVQNPFKFPLSFSLREPNSKSSFKKHTFSSLDFVELEGSSSSSFVASRPMNIDGIEDGDAYAEAMQSDKSVEKTSFEDANQGRIVSAVSEGTQSFSFFGRKSLSRESDNERDAPRKGKYASLPQENLKDSSARLNRETGHQSNGRFSIIQGATMHSQSPRLKKAAIPVDNEGYNSANSDSPYVIHSLSSTEWVALPFSKSRIGPIIFNPKLKMTESRTGVFYVFNNFTGFDKVEVISSFGHANLIVADVFASSPPCDGLCSFANKTSFEVQSTGEDKWEIHGVIVNKLSERFLIGVRNEGDVAASILDIVVDGESCDSMWKWIASFFGVGYEPVNIFCKFRPITIPANVTLQMVMTAPTLCIYAKKRGSLAFVVENFSDRQFDSKVEVVFDFTLSPEVSAKCVEIDGMSNGYRVLFSSCIFGVILLLLACCANYVIIVSSRYKKHKMNKTAGLEHSHIRKSRKYVPSAKIVDKYHPSSIPATTISLPVSSTGVDLSDVISSSLENSPPSTSVISNLSTLITITLAGKGAVRIRAVETLLKKRESRVAMNVRITPQKPKELTHSNIATAESSPSDSDDLTLGTNQTPNMTTAESSRNNSTSHIHMDSAALAALLTKGKESQTTNHLFLHLDDNFAEPDTERVDKMGSLKHNLESPETLSLSGTSISTEDAHSRESSLGSNVIIQDIYSSSTSTTKAMVGNSNSGKLRSSPATPPISPSGNGSGTHSFIAVQTKKKTHKLNKAKTAESEVVSGSEAGQHHRPTSQIPAFEGAVLRSPSRTPVHSSTSGSDDFRLVPSLALSSTIAGIAEEHISTRSSAMKSVAAKQKITSNASKPPSHGAATVSLKSEVVPSENSAISFLPSKGRAPIGEPTESLLTIIADVRASLVQQQHVQNFAAETNSHDLPIPSSVPNPQTPRQESDSAAKSVWTLPQAASDSFIIPANFQLIEESTQGESINPPYEEVTLDFVDIPPSMIVAEMGQSGAYEVAENTLMEREKKNHTGSRFASYSALDDDADDIDAILHVAMDDENLALSVLPPQMPSSADISMSPDINDSPLFYYSNNLLEGDDVLSPVNDKTAFATNSPSLEDMEFKKGPELNPEAAPFETFASRSAHLQAEHQLLRSSFYPAVSLGEIPSLSLPPLGASTAASVSGGDDITGGFTSDTLRGFHLSTYSSELGTHLGVGFDFAGVDFPYSGDSSFNLPTPPAAAPQHRAQQQPYSHSTRSTSSSLLTSDSNRPRKAHYEDNQSIFSSFFDDSPNSLFPHTNATLSSSSMSSESFSTSTPQAPPPGLAAINTNKNNANRLSYSSKESSLSSHISFPPSSSTTHSMYGPSATTNSSFLGRSSLAYPHSNSAFAPSAGAHSLSARMSSKLSADSSSLLDFVEPRFSTDKYYNEPESYFSDPFSFDDDEEGLEREGAQDTVLLLNAIPPASTSPQLRSSPSNKTPILQDTIAHPSESIFYSSRFATSPTELTTMDTFQRGGWGMSPRSSATSSTTGNTTSTTHSRAGYQTGLSPPSYRSQRAGLHSRGMPASGSVRSSRDMLTALPPQHGQTQIPAEYLRSANQHGSSNSTTIRRTHPLQPLLDETSSNPNNVLSPQNKPSSAKF